MSGQITIADFMRDAKQTLAGTDDLAQAKLAIAASLSELSARDDLTRDGYPLGANDANSSGYLLWREPPYFTLMLVRFDQYFMSPIHDHGKHWVIGCCWRGMDRWDVYERRDGGTGPGPCELEMVDQVVLKPGDTTSLGPPPRTIHSHNNVSPDGDTLELIFSPAPPTPVEERLLYDLPTNTCRATWCDISNQLQGDFFPPRA